MKKLSIIVPAYKVEDYIAACLDSLLDQGLDHADYEIIVINDGSPDNSKAIAEEYASRYSNIIVGDQENKGVSVARNHGLEMAQGEYIAFVDPDDTIYPKALSRIIARAEEQHLDVVYLSLEVYDESGKLLQTMEPNGKDDVVLEGFSHPRRTFLSTLFRRPVIGNIRFKEGITRGQDTVFNAMVQSMAKRVGYCSLPYYRYLQRGSSSRQFVGTERNFVSALLAIETINNFQKANFPNPTDNQSEYFDDAMLIFVQRLLEWNIFPQKSQENFNRLKKRLKELGLGRLIKKMSKRFPMFDRSWTVFLTYLRLKYLSQRIRQLFGL